VDGSAFHTLFISFLLYMDDSVVFVVGAVDSWITGRFVPEKRGVAGHKLWRKGRVFPLIPSVYPQVDLWITSFARFIPKLSAAYPKRSSLPFLAFHKICPVIPNFPQDLPLLIPSFSLVIESISLQSGWEVGEKVEMVLPGIATSPPGLSTKDVGFPQKAGSFAQSRVRCPSAPPW
jgi:hypothetical protein